MLTAHLEMDLLTYGIWLQALWMIPTILSEIDLDRMRAETLERGDNADIRLVASLIQLKKEDHAR